MKPFTARLAATFAALLYSAAAFAAAPDKPFSIQLEKRTRPPVTFDHGKHKELKCAECHHKDAPGKEQKCSACHEAADVGKKLQIKEAFHKNCRDCHKAVKKGPTGCADCHRK